MARNSLVEHLAIAGRAAPSADNSQSWRMVWDGSCLNLQFRATGHTDLSPSPSDTATLLAMGGVIENIMQMGARLQLDLQLETHPDDPGRCASITVGKLEQKQDLPRDHPLFSRHTNRFAYAATPLPEDVKSELVSMRDGSANILLFDEADSIRGIANLIKTASGVRFRVRQAHEWLAGSLRFNTSEEVHGSGMDVRSLDLPPGGATLLRITRSWRVMSALNKLGVYRFMAAADSAPVFAAPALVAIRASSDSAGAIEAGRLLTRAWIRLNELNIAVHPYYVITDQLARLREHTLPGELEATVAQIKEECSRRCALSDSDSLYMVLRVGYPKRAAPRSLRVALAEVYLDQSDESAAGQ